MTPFCCQAGVSADRESNMASCRWNANEGHGTVQGGEKEKKKGGRERKKEKREGGSPSEGAQLFLCKLSHLLKKKVKKKNTCGFHSIILHVLFTI